MLRQHAAVLLIKRGIGRGRRGVFFTTRIFGGKQRGQRRFCGSWFHGFHDAARFILNFSVARAIAHKMSEAFGQQVVVENRIGIVGA